MHLPFQFLLFQFKKKHTAKIYLPVINKITINNKNNKLIIIKHLTEIK